MFTVHMSSLHRSAWAPTSERRMAASLQMVDFKEEYGASVRNSHQAEAITFDDTRSMFKSIEANKDYEVGEILAQVSFQVFLLAWFL